jgi:hypothetical protein
LIVFDSLTIAKKALDATNDQQLMGYKLLITLRHPSTYYTDTSIEQKTPVETSNTESIALVVSSVEKPVQVNTQENGSISMNGETTLTQISSISLSSSSILPSDKKPDQTAAAVVDITPEKLLFEQLADVFLKDLKNRVAGPSIHDFLKSARAERLEKENAPEDIIDDFVKIEPSQQQKIIESLVNNSSKLPRFKKKQKSLPSKRDYESFVYQESSEQASTSQSAIVEKPSRAATPVFTTSSSSEEGEYHSGPEEEPTSDITLAPAIATPLDTSVHSPSSPTRKLSKKPAVESRPRGLRDYLSDEESDVDEHDAFLKQLHRQEEFNDGESESDDFVENDYQEDRKRKRASNIKKPASKKQKKIFYSDEDTSEYDSTSKIKLKQPKKKQVRKKKKQQLQESFAPILPERIYEVIEEDLSKDSSSSGMDEEDDEEEDEIEPKVEVDQEEIERTLLAPDESDSEELKEPQLQTTDPPEWDPLNQIEDPEDYCFLRAALLDRAGIELKGNST